jgi:hypothetical protein
MRRWSSDGEVRGTSATDFGFSADLIALLSNDDQLSRVGQRPEVTQHALEDGTLVWTIHPDAQKGIANRLSPQTVEDWANIALRLICFACPPCYEGKVNW